MLRSLIRHNYYRAMVMKLLQKIILIYLLIVSVAVIIVFTCINISLNNKTTIEVSLKSNSPILQHTVQL